ncbi:hypothetical protein P152DRAFT_468937 [Eremomyces bilateralis CBS 781.70]|uniref:SET domain-containing protein n=1 Tax=Eremomyces bilateralis CBS 781.70 TaxID=1392243 RepID=A0A6G1FS20_9PEZI|nr:uncharacterized protein P152DRAFT_468937 [Eremomyces bilateralis CBS 781.70]KAF1808573.1 hypothetical protein P152DRAFT_468937 [Eremomyces bilateralis CBS 781.70]
MNVHDVTNQYAQQMREHKRTLLNAQKSAAYAKFALYLILGVRKPKDGQLETHHRGMYLLLRSLTPPQRMTGVQVLMEDEEDDVMLLQLYLQEDETIRPAIDVVTVGTILLVKEPYFKVTANGQCGPRVDHLSDIIHIQRDDTRVPYAWRLQLIDLNQSAETLKLEGNSAMAAKEYRDVITEYTYALRQTTTENEIEIIKRNRSLAFLRTKQFDAALADTGFPNFGPNPAEKALFRASEALYFLKRFADCWDVLELLCKPFQAPASGGGSESSPAALGSRYIHRPVEVKQTGSKGRGLVTTKAVKAGDLLLCEKAFSHAHVSDEIGSAGGNAKISLLINTENNKVLLGGQAGLITIIAQKLYNNPSVASAFNSLYHGSYKGVSASAVDGEPIVPYRENRGLENAFGSPVSSLLSHRKMLTGKPKADKTHHSCGIWIMASYINHNCISTARRTFIGDMMIVRAACDMEPGTEVTFWYRSPEYKLTNGSGDKFKHWGFVCDCAICKDARETGFGAAEDRRRLLRSLKQIFNLPALHDAQIVKVERLLKAFDDTYTHPADQVPRLPLCDSHLVLVWAHASRRYWIKCLGSFGNVLTSLGFVAVGVDSSTTRFSITKWGLVINTLVEVFLHAQAAFTGIEAMEDAKRAGEYAKAAYKIILGENTTFYKTYKTVDETFRNLRMSRCAKASKRIALLVGKVHEVEKRLTTKSFEVEDRARAVDR